jgi:hypothetical protein
MSGRKPNRPWKQAFDKLGEMPVPSLRQVFDKLGEKPGKPDLRQAFDKFGEKPVPSLRQVFDKLGEKPGKPDLRQAFDKFGEKPVPSLRQVFDKLGEIDLTPPAPLALPTKPPPKRMRKKGAGHPRALTDDEITRGRRIVGSALLQSPKLARKSNDDLAKHFRPLFKFKRKVSDRTLWRHIIGPLLVGRRRTK